MSLPINVTSVGGDGMMPPGGGYGMMPPGGGDGMMPPPPPLKKSRTGLYIGIAAAVVVVIIIIIIIIVIVVIYFGRSSNSVKTGAIQYDTMSNTWNLPAVKRSSNTAIPEVQYNTANGIKVQSVTTYIYHIFEFTDDNDNSTIVAAPTWLDAPPNPGAYNSDFNQAFTVKNFDNKDLKITVSLWRYLSETALTGVKSESQNGAKVVKSLGTITLETLKKSSTWKKVISDVAFTGNKQFIEPVQSLVDAYYQIYSTKLV